MKPISRAVSADLLCEDHPDFMLGLHMALGDNRPTGGEPSPKVTDLLAKHQRRPDADFSLCGCHQSNRLVAAAVVIKSPGGAGLVHFGVDNQHAAGRRDAAAACLNSLADRANTLSIELLEVLVDPYLPFEIDILNLSTFTYLTNLIYLTRDVSRPTVSFPCTQPLTWIPYDESQEDLFSQALQATYAETLDCRELSGLRPTKAVLADHRVTGVFSPSRWWVALTSDGPAGVILVNKIEFQPAVEIVYVGVAKHARGRGVSDALLCRVFDTSRASGDRLVTLAVDERNLPARKMYDRWGFEQALIRQAWIATSAPLHY